jgi:hypothetical protein
MVLIVFILYLVFSLVNQIIAFVISIYTEIVLRV